MDDIKSLLSAIVEKKTKTANKQTTKVLKEIVLNENDFKAFKIDCLQKMANSKNPYAKAVLQGLKEDKFKIENFFYKGLGYTAKDNSKKIASFNGLRYLTTKGKTQFVNIDNL